MSRHTAASYPSTLKMRRAVRQGDQADTRRSGLAVKCAESRQRALDLLSDLRDELPADLLGNLSAQIGVPLSRAA